MVDKAKFLKEMHDGILLEKLKSASLLDKQFLYNPNEWKAVATYYFNDNNLLNDKVKRPVLTGFLQNFAPEKYQHGGPLPTIKPGIRAKAAHVVAGEAVADFVFNFYIASKPRTKTGLKVFCGDLIDALPLDKKGKKAFYARMNAHIKINRIFNTPVVLDDKKPIPTKEFYFGVDKDEKPLEDIEYHEMVSNHLTPTLSVLLDIKKSVIEVTESIEALLTPDMTQDHVLFNIFVMVENQDDLMVSSALNSATTKDRLYRAMRAVLINPSISKQRLMEHFEKPGREYLLEIIKDIKRTPPQPETNYYYTIRPSVKRVPREPMTLMSVAMSSDKAQAVKAYIQEIKNMFTVGYLKAHQTQMLAGLGLVALVAFVFISLATYGILPLTTVIFTLPVMGKISMGAFLLTTVLTPAYELGAWMSKKVFGSELQKAYEETLDMQNLERMAKAERKELVFIDETGEVDPQVTNTLNNQLEGELNNDGNNELNKAITPSNS